MDETPGTILKKARKLRNLTIAQASKATRIRVLYLEAMESDQFSVLPSLVHARGFIRNYAEFLGLNGNDLVSRIDPSPKPDNSSSSPIAETISNQKPPSNLVIGEPEADPLPVAPILPEFEENAPDQKHDRLEAIQSSPIPHSQDPQEDFTSGSHLIFEAIGEKLQKQREALSLSLEEVEVYSRVRKHYLESIEAGDFEKLPSTVQARGMLVNYARFLEIDQEEILLQYADGLQAQRNEKHSLDKGKSDSPTPLIRFSSIRRYISIDLLVGSGLIIIMIVFAFWATGNVINRYNSPSTVVTARSISDIILTPLETKSQTESTQEQSILMSTQTPFTNIAGISTIQGTGTGRVQVYAVILQSTWMRVTVDGKIAFEGRVLPGSAFEYNGNDQVELITGSGSAIQIIHNQTDLGVMGLFGEVVDRIYTSNSVLVPTATLTPIPTKTGTPTITPRYTKTPSPTATPIYSPVP